MRYKNFFLLSLLCLFFCSIDSIVSAEESQKFLKKDIPYFGYDRSLEKSNSLDVYYSGAFHEAPLPVVIFVHGGAWKIGDKRMVDSKPKAFVEHGYVFVSVNYRLYPEAKYWQQTADVAGAIKWVYENIGSFGGDPNNIYLLGHSSGGHLISLIGTDSHYLADQGLDTSVIKGIIPVDSAIYDMPMVMKYSKDSIFLKKICLEVFGDDPETWETASPISYVKRGADIPDFLVIYAVQRRSSGMMSRSFSRKMKIAGHSATLYGARNRSHRTINTQLGAKGDQVFVQIHRFIQRR